MKFFAAALQGSTIFVTVLLIQVVIVASLALTALWLYFKRFQNVDEEIEESTQHSELLVSLNAAQQKTEELQKINRESLEKIQTLEAKLSQYEVLKSEYEVLKEETKDLTQFKEENIRLKEKLTALESEGMKNPTDPGIESIISEIEALTAEKKEDIKKSA